MPEINSLHPAQNQVKTVLECATRLGLHRAGREWRGRNPGLEAAETAAARWQAEGRAVRIIKPNVPGKDFNDILTAREAGKAAAK